MTLRRRRRGEARPAADGSLLRWPGARARFALFGEVLWVGMLMTLIALPVVTWPAAVAAGSQHLRRYLYGEATPVSGIFRDAVRTLPGSLVVGAASVPLGAVVGLDLALVAGGSLPGRQIVGIVVATVGAVAVLLAVIAASMWTPGAPWRGLLAVAPRVARADVSGTAYAAAAVFLAVVITWQWVPLGIPVLGMLTFALVAIGERRMVRLTRAAQRTRRIDSATRPGVVPVR